MHYNRNSDTTGLTAPDPLPSRRELLCRIGGGFGALALTAYIVPFSSPLAMVAYGAQSETLWPHLLALVWQTLWIVLIIRVSSRLFKATVLKSGSSGSFFSFLNLRRKAKSEA